jgi:hypothetical protein
MAHAQLQPVARAWTTEMICQEEEETLRVKANLQNPLLVGRLLNSIGGPVAIGHRRLSDVQSVI